jgi:hypothetical protein
MDEILVPNLIQLKVAYQRALTKAGQNLNDSIGISNELERQADLNQRLDYYLYSQIKFFVGKSIRYHLQFVEGR